MGSPPLPTSPGPLQILAIEKWRTTKNMVRSWQSISNELERIIVRFRRQSQGDEPLLRFDCRDYPSDLNDQVIPQE